MLRQIVRRALPITSCLFVAKAAFGVGRRRSHRPLGGELCSEDGERRQRRGSDSRRRRRDARDSTRRCSDSVPLGMRLCQRVSGIAAGVATGSLTGNPALGTSVAIAVKAGVDEAGKTVARRSEFATQDAIVSAAGDKRAGETTTWRVKHQLSGRTESGEVRVVRVVKTRLAVCKELLFSVGHAGGQEAASPWFTTNACHDVEQWRWASAEPAVARWGTLQ